MLGGVSWESGFFYEQGTCGRLLRTGALADQGSRDGYQHALRGSSSSFLDLFCWKEEHPFEESGDPFGVCFERPTSAGLRVGAVSGTLPSSRALRSSTSSSPQLSRSSQRTAVGFRFAGIRREACSLDSSCGNFEIIKKIIGCKVSRQRATVTVLPGVWGVAGSGCLLCRVLAEGFWRVPRI